MTEGSAPLISALESCKHRDLSNTSPVGGDGDTAHTQVLRIFITHAAGLNQTHEGCSSELFFQEVTKTPVPEERNEKP